MRKRKKNHRTNSKKVAQSDDRKHMKMKNKGEKPARIYVVKRVWEKNRKEREETYRREKG